MKNIKQVNLYNFNTRDFYTEEELKQRNNFNVLEFYNKNMKYYEEKITYYHSINDEEKVVYYQNKIDELDKRKNSITEVEPSELKSRLRNLVKSNESQRTYNNDINKAKKVSTFSSTFTRALGIDESKIEKGDFAFTDKIIIVKVDKDVDKHIQNDMMSQLIKRGFTFDNKVYQYVFSGAGQIRTKKLVFCEVNTYDKAKDKLYAGLTDEMINSKGGAVVGKLLAYRALSASASVEWSKHTGKSFNINECIVVKDFEHTIKDVEVESIDWDYNISDVKTKDIINPVTDGAGIMLESVHNKNIQFRAPWMKGLLSPFPFDEFIKLHKVDLDAFEIEDAWGKPQSLKGVKIIFTESQFKMKNYFESWEAYKIAFKKYKCEFAICNEESLNAADFKDSTIAYQMLQTLHSMTNDEIESITSFTHNKINAINKATNDWYTKDENGDVTINVEAKNILLDVLGVNTDYTYKRPFTNAIQLASDNLLFDKYVQQSILNTRDAMLKDAKAGKLIMEGSRTVYILPDFYAFCEWLFLGEESPEGLLEADEVSCALYDNNFRINMLRSPHLYIEHCIHTNQRSEELSKWFRTNGVHVSVNSTASHQLAYDVDGDTSLLVPEIEAFKSSYTFVKCAERHMQDVYVLDYEMATSGKVEITNKTLVDALKKSFKANIGTISNQITKILNKDTVLEEDLKLVKLLKMKNNMVIDFAKTNFDPPIKKEELKDKLEEIKKIPLPYFFKFAKDTKDVDEVTSSTMNRISARFNEDFDKVKFAKDGTFDGSLMVRDLVGLNKQVSEAIINTYNEFVNNKANTTQMMQEIEGQDDDALKFYVKSNKIEEFKKQMLSITDDEYLIVDVLINYLYQKHYDDKGKRIYKNKNLHTLWEAFGDVLLHNIDCKLLDKKQVRCDCCKTVIDKKSNRQTKCEPCAEKAKRIAAAKRKAKSRAKVAS